MQPGLRQEMVKAFGCIVRLVLAVLIVADTLLTALYLFIGTGHETLPPKWVGNVLESMWEPFASSTFLFLPFVLFVFGLLIVRQVFRKTSIAISLLHATILVAGILTWLFYKEQFFWPSRIGR